jgi:hypothetical protein
VEQLQKLLPLLPFKLPWQQQREEDAERLISSAMQSLQQKF